MSDYIHPERLRGYFITFTTYGARLHGDPRGTVDDGRRGYGEPDIGALPRLMRSDAEQMRHAPVLLDAPRRQLVGEAIREVCDHRGWELLALNVRTNHVHLLVTAEAPAETVMNTFKAYATRALRRSRLVANDAKVWTRHGSTRYVWSETVMTAVQTYIVEEQGQVLAGSRVVQSQRYRDPER